MRLTRKGKERVKHLYLRPETPITAPRPHTNAARDRHSQPQTQPATRDTSDRTRQTRPTDRPTQQASQPHERQPQPQTHETRDAIETHATATRHTRQPASRERIRHRHRHDGAATLREAGKEESEGDRGNEGHRGLMLRGWQNTRN